MTTRPTQQRPAAAPTPAVPNGSVSPGITPARATPADPRRESCDATYATLVAAGPKRRTRTNLDNLRRALDHLIATKSPDFSVANVIRVRRELGMKSPGTSAVYNDQGGPFDTLINAYGAAYGTPKPGHAGGPAGGEYDDLVYAVADEALAQRVRWLVNENRGLKVQLDAARAAFGKLRAIPPRALLAYAQGELAPEPVASGVSEDDAATVRRFLERADDLLPCEWDADTGALRLRQSGMQVAGPRFRQVLETIAAGPPTPVPPGPPQRRLRSPGEVEQ